MKRWFDRNRYHEGNAVKLLQSGPEFFSELEKVINAAQHFIHVQLYILDDDETGLRIIELLKKAANRGVKIYIIVDGYGSLQLTSHTIKDIQQAGIRFKVFSPVHKLFIFRVGRRLHHKIILVDGVVSLIGGINVAGKYEGYRHHKAWLDFAIKLEGKINKDVLKVCEDVWGKRMKSVFQTVYHQFIKYTGHKDDIKVRLLQNDFARRNIEISRFYRQSIKRSEQSLVIVASYFLPGNRMRYLLRRASLRGVKIKLLLGSVSDVGLTREATNYLYPFLLRNNIEIYEWKESVMHGKLMIVDDKVTTVGSYNINTLSDYGSLELNACVNDVDFALSSKKRIEKLIDEGCVRINKEDYVKQHYWWNQVINWISYQIVRSMFKFFFFLLRK